MFDDLGVAGFKEHGPQVGVVPLRRLDFPEGEYEKYVVHGLPKKEQRDGIEQTEDYIDCSATVMPVAFQVTPFASGTAGFPQTRRQRFYASVPAEVKRANWTRRRIGKGVESERYLADLHDTRVCATQWRTEFDSAEPNSERWSKNERATTLRKRL